MWALSCGQWEHWKVPEQGSSIVLDAQQGHVCSAFLAGLPVKGRFQEEAGLEMSPGSGVAREHLERQTWPPVPGPLLSRWFSSEELFTPLQTECHGSSLLT